MKVSEGVFLVPFKKSRMAPSHGSLGERKGKEQVRSTEALSPGGIRTCSRSHSTESWELNLDLLINPVLFWVARTDHN